MIPEMPCCPSDSAKPTDEAVDALNADQAQVEEQDKTDRRAEARSLSCAACELWIFTNDGESRKVTDVVTRTSSFCGLSVVAKLPAPIRVGRPAEATIAMSDGQKTYAAGTVTFCRTVNKGYYEIGIQVRAAGPSTILLDDISSAKAHYEWFADALRIEV